MARDFGFPAKVITDILGKYGEAPKSNMQALEDKELSVIFEHLTQNNQISSIAAIYADEPKKPESAPAPKAEAAPKAEPAHKAEAAPAKPAQAAQAKPAVSQQAQKPGGPAADSKARAAGGAAAPAEAQQVHGHCPAHHPRTGEEAGGHPQGRRRESGEV